MNKKERPRLGWNLPVLVTLFCATFLSACGIVATPVAPTVTPPPALVLFPTPPKNWRVYATPTFQLALPEGWQELVLAEASLQAIIKQNQTANPDLSRSLQDLIDSAQYKDLLFYATDTRATGIISNVTVAHTKPGGEARSEDIAKKASDALAKNLPTAKNATPSALVSVNGIDAAQVRYDIPFKNASGTVVILRGVQFYFLVSPQDLYVLTISGDAANDLFASTADQIGKSFVAVKK